MKYELEINYDEVNILNDEKSFKNTRKKVNEITVDHIEVLQNLNPLEKEVGDYITIHFDNYNDHNLRENISEVVCKELKTLLPKAAKKFLIVGLGNENVIADALGPMVCDNIVVTSHLIALEHLSSDVSDVSVIVPRVMGQTGIESANLVLAISEKIKPDVIIVIDALATRTLERINHVIQISNTGIHPGHGVGNKRLAIHESIFKIPVIAIGVATVISIQDVFKQCMKLTTEISETKVQNMISEFTHSAMIVTPKEMDEDIKHLSSVISLGINQCLFDDFSEF